MEVEATLRFNWIKSDQTLISRHQRGAKRERVFVKYTENGRNLIQPKNAAKRRSVDVPAATLTNEQLVHLWSQNSVKTRRRESRGVHVFPVASHDSQLEPLFSNSCSPSGNFALDYLH